MSDKQVSTLAFKKVFCAFSYFHFCEILPQLLCLWYTIHYWKYNLDILHNQCNTFFFIEISNLSTVIITQAKQVSITWDEEATSMASFSSECKSAFVHLDFWHLSLFHICMWLLELWLVQQGWRQPNKNTNFGFSNVWCKTNGCKSLLAYEVRLELTEVVV